MTYHCRPPLASWKTIARNDNHLDKSIRLRIFSSFNQYETSDTKSNTIFTESYNKELLSTMSTLNVAKCFNQTGKLHQSYDINASSVIIATCLFDTGAGINLVNLTLLSSPQINCINRRQMPHIFNVPKNNFRWKNRYFSTSVLVTY